MSIEQRLRTGLSANTEHLQPDLDRELAALLSRGHRRRRARAAGYGVVAAAVVAAVVIWLPGVADSIRSNVETDPAERPTSTPQSPVPNLHEGRVPPGTYSVPLRGGLSPLPVIEVPKGFRFQPTYGLLEKPSAGQGQEPRELQGVGFTNGQGLEVDVNLCESNGRKDYKDPGPTVEDLAAALVNQPRLHPTDPVPVSLGGYDGLYVELSLPKDASACAGARTLWLEPGPGYHTNLQRAVVDRFWILDVEGQRLVIDAFNGSAVSDNEVDELIRIAESTTFPSTE